MTGLLCLPVEELHDLSVLQRDAGVGAAETGESVALGRTRKREGWGSQRG
jgi:hypothetical protein